MKIYNIHNSKEFFEKLASCRGEIDLVKENGEQIRLLPGSADLSSLPMAHIQGTIRQMELRFQDAEDCRKIFDYLLNKRGLSA